MIAGFWRRVGAALLDSIIVGAVGVLLGLLFSEQFLRMGGWALLVGAAVTLLYFVPLNSRLGNGRTLGKRVLRICVIGGNGQPIGVGRSLVRACIFFLPFFLNGAPAGPLALSQWFLYLFSIAVFGFGVAIVYLFVFNRRTRQSLHDLIVGSYVVRLNEEEATALPRMWKGHYIVLALILLLAAIAPAMMTRVINRTSMAEVTPPYEAILNEPEVATAQVMQGTTFLWSSTGNHSSNYLTATVRVKGRLGNQDAEAKKIAGIVLEKDPAAVRRDVINVVLVEGWSIGIAASFHSQAFPFSPLQWRTQINEKRAPSSQF